jgi:hypothetical protein
MAPTGLALHASRPLGPAPVPPLPARTLLRPHGGCDTTGTTPMSRTERTSRAKAIPRPDKATPRATPRGYRPTGTHGRTTTCTAMVSTKHVAEGRGVTTLSSQTIGQRAGSVRLVEKLCSIYLLNPKSISWRARGQRDGGSARTRHNSTNCIKQRCKTSARRLPLNSSQGGARDQSSSARWGRRPREQFTNMS